MTAVLCIELEPAACFIWVGWVQWFGFGLCIFHFIEQESVIDGCEDEEEEEEL